MTKPSSEKEPLIPEQGDIVAEHTVIVGHAQSSHHDDQAHNEDEAHNEEQLNPEQLEEGQRFTENLRELFLFLVSTGIELPNSFVWKMLCIFLYALAGVVFPVLVTWEYHTDFVVLSTIVLGVHIFFSAICFSYISRIVWKQGTKSYLLLEKLTKSALAVQAHYTGEIKSFRFSWICSLISCLVARGIYEIVRLVFMPNISWFMILASTLSFIAWTFLSMTILSACNFFGLACRLVIVPLKDFGEHLNQKPPTSDIWEELKSIRSNVLQISSNFSWFLFRTFLVVNVNFMLIMLHSLAHNEMIHVIINCDFLLYAIVQVFGLSICLHSVVAIVSSKVLEITPLLCAGRVEDLLHSNDGGEKDTIAHALCEYSRFALDGLSVCGYTIDISAVVGIIFFKIGIIQFILGSQSNLLGAAMGTFFYR